MSIRHFLSSSVHCHSTTGWYSQGVEQVAQKLKQAYMFLDKLRWSSAPVTVELLIGRVEIIMLILLSFRGSCGVRLQKPMHYFDLSVDQNLDICRGASIIADPLWCQTVLATFSALPHLNPALRGSGGTSLTLNWSPKTRFQSLRFRNFI